MFRGHLDRRVQLVGLVMQKIGFCLAALWLLVLAPASPVGAETGPCLADQAGVMTCGKGQGAARVVDGTTSPSNASHSPGALPAARRRNRPIRPATACLQSRAC